MIVLLEMPTKTIYKMATMKNAYNTMYKMAAVKIKRVSKSKKPHIRAEANDESLHWHDNCTPPLVGEVSYQIWGYPIVLNQCTECSS